MMSKRLFFKVMREDLRHKIWMIALSVLGNFLALPIAWLLFKNNMPSSGVNATANNTLNVSLDILLSSIMDFFSSKITILGGAVAIAGAVIVGLFSFRYLFHKNMVDTWHSMPIKRNTLYAVGYVDGLLIWFVPFLGSLLLTVIMAGNFVYAIGGGQALALLLKEVLVSLATLIIAYLLVYHLVLTAVMLCGNILNTLVCTVILGFGAISVSVVGTGLCSSCLDTFVEWSYSLEMPGYASPLFSAICLLYSRAKSVNFSALSLLSADVQRNSMGFADLGRALIVNLAVAAVLGLCAWLLYQKRESELAEQGIKNKAAAALLRMFAGLAAGMSGWMMLILLTENRMSLSWGIFGTVLGTVLVFGVLDIVFQMDAKGFFAHKLQMGATLCLALLIGASIHGDCFGYDAYLPQKDEIAGIAIYSSYFKNRTFYGGVLDYAFDDMEFQDTEVIYAYLERMTDNQEFKSSANYDSIVVKVTLKNSKSYFRRYKIHEQDKELIWPILTSEEYLQTAYGIREEEMANVLPHTLGRPGSAIHLGNYGQEEISSIIRAYNQDILEDPERTLLGRGKLLAAMYLDIMDNAAATGHVSVRLDIYDTMEHTLEALRQAGYEEVADVPDVSDISSVELLLWSGIGEDATPEEVIDRARQYYGVFGQTEGEVQEAEETQTAEQAVVTISGVRERKEVSITDRAEMEELFSYISFLQPYPLGSIFQKEWVEIAIVQENKEHYCYIPWGVLPEKYILRFGEF